jgi:predicted nucleotidyltransferase
MSAQPLSFIRHQEEFIDRFVAACQADARVIAAFLGGSYVTGTADLHSDLDLSLITSDAAYQEFLADRTALLRQLGEPAFLEDFDHPHVMHFVYPDGTEGELWFASESHLDHIHSGPYRVLLDKQHILAAAVFPPDEQAPAAQVEVLRRLICWFWHDLSHFTAAMGRRQVWWAYGQLGILRGYCVNLARLRQDFTAPVEAYDKVDEALPAELLAPLQASCCPLEYAAMLQAAAVIIRFYQALAPRLAEAHGLAYPEALERVMIGRLERLPEAQPE